MHTTSSLAWRGAEVEDDQLLGERLMLLHRDDVTPAYYPHTRAAHTSTPDVPVGAPMALLCDDRTVSAGRLSTSVHTHDEASAFAKLPTVRHVARMAT